MIAHEERSLHYIALFQGAQDFKVLTALDFKTFQIDAGAVLKQSSHPIHLNESAVEDRVSGKSYDFFVKQQSVLEKTLVRKPADIFSKHHFLNPALLGQYL